MGPGSVAMLLATGEKERDDIFAAPSNPQRGRRLACRHWHVLCSSIFASYVAAVDVSPNVFVSCIVDTANILRGTL